VGFKNRLSERGKVVVGKKVALARGRVKKARAFDGMRKKRAVL